MSKRLNRLHLLGCALVMLLAVVPSVAQGNAAKAKANSPAPVSQSGKQSSEPFAASRRHARPTVITDAAGRIHVRSPRLTETERRAAAKNRVNGIRAAARKAALTQHGNGAKQ